MLNIIPSTNCSVQSQNRCNGTVNFLCGYIQDAPKDLLGSTIKKMMEAEMDENLGYEKPERSNNDGYRNGYKRKQVNSRYGSMAIQVPQDRKSTFEPQVVKKRQKDISDIDQKIISMYAKGMITCQTRKR